MCESTHGGEALALPFWDWSCWAIPPYKLKPRRSQPPWAILTWSTTPPTRRMAMRWKSKGLVSQPRWGFFARERYGAPRIVPTDTGIIVRYESSYNSDTHEWAESTVPHEPGTAFVGTCYSWNQSTYRTSGCEHFGIGYGGPHGKISHRWLIEDPNAPGTLIPYFPEALVASPNISRCPRHERVRHPS